MEAVKGNAGGREGTRAKPCKRLVLDIVGLSNLYNSGADNFCCALQIEATGILKRSFAKLNPEHCMMIGSGFKTCRLEKCFPSCALKSNILYFVVQNVFLLLVNQK